MGGVTEEPRSGIGVRYRIVRELGHGGMATVFLATDTVVGREVAMKVLHPDLAAAVGAERFHREIRIASTLTHPNILPVYDSGELDGRLFYVMPCVEGESLRDLLHRERQLAIDDAVRITCEIASALEYAHAHGIVHRDIKPENILLEAGHAVVSDFGIARAASSIGDAPVLTQSGMSLGTPAYMSPEQGLGEKTVDGRSDQYSLACVAYEMLAGEPPFTAATTQALIARHVGTPAPLISTVRPAVSDELQEVILRALEKVPADRYPNMGEFAAALAEADIPEGTAARLVPGTRASRSTRSSRIVRAERRSAQRALRRRIAIAVTALMSLGAGTAAWRWAHQTKTVASNGTVDAKRVAVLYFDDLSPDRHLRYLADGLTEGLIERLRDVQTLDVVSRDGVGRLCRGQVAPDSAARALGVGTVVTGSVEPEGNRVRVALRLLDGPSGADFRRVSFTVPEAALVTARDSVAEETSRMLRAYFGEEVRLREQREQAHDTRAWSLLQLAERMRKDGEESADADSAAASRAFESADSLLALAESRDSAWSQPSVLRARTALRRSRLDRTSADAARRIAVGLAHADRAVRLDPRSADALEVRGTLRYERFVRNLSANPVEERSLVRDAERDLLRATEIAPAQANAWNVLSALYYRKTPPDVTGANINARRALEADAYLAAADEVLWRLFATSYDLGQYDQAVKWCDEGHRRFGAEARFTQCRLYIGFMKEHRPNVAESWRAVRELVERTPAARRPLVERQANMLAAISLVYTGQPDSARRVLAAARADRTMDPEGALLTPEALVRVRLGDRAEAIRLLKLFLSEHPQHRAGMTRNTWWWKDLENDPDFKALVGAR